MLLPTRVLCLPALVPLAVYRALLRRGCCFRARVPTKFPPSRRLPTNAFQSRAVCRVAESQRVIRVLQFLLRSKRYPRRCRREFFFFPSNLFGALVLLRFALLFYDRALGALATISPFTIWMITHGSE